jgi:hypothetical protein
MSAVDIRRLSSSPFCTLIDLIKIWADGHTKSR